MVVKAYMGSTMDHTDSEKLLKSSSKSSTPSPAVCRRKRGIVQKGRFDVNSCDIRARLVIFAMCISFMVYIGFYADVWKIILPLPQMIVKIPPNDAPGQQVPPEYLVYSPNCQIPALDPLASDVMKLFERELYKPCSSLPPLTFIRLDEASGLTQLLVNTTLLKPYNELKHAPIDRCCFQDIRRSGTNKEADNHFSLGKCIPIKKNVAHLNESNEFILVRCKSGETAVYTNTHAIIRQRPAIRDRLDTFSAANPQQRPLSVLMMSIDSISRLNLLRALPKTAQHLYDTGWFELQGYNKMDDNTFPNLMAILLGYNSTMAYDQCIPTQLGRLDACPFVWKDFRNAGYVTAYGEDEASISTFNYHKLGFERPPTDYYMRPYMLAAEKNLKVKKRFSLTLCLGYQNSVDHIYQYALDFAAKYNNDPFFGLFWTNTFSHNDISEPSSMDDKMNAYLEQMRDRDILNNSAVVFFSDHGIRFGPVRKLVTGWLEERLPFMFIWLPPWFREANPDIVRALKINRNRLTNPYDLHVTLKHILNLSGRQNETLAGAADSCKSCHSLFEEMDPNRSCEQASIAPHWCTCPPFNSHSKSSSLVRGMVDFVVKRINDDLRQYAAGTAGKTQCAVLRKKYISYARKAENQSKNTDVYLIVFETSPNDATFETTVEHNLKSGKFQLTGSVSRLNPYADQSTCMANDTLRKYCYCLGHNG